MSFAFTKEQIKNKNKTVTHRTDWLLLKIGGELNAVNQSMGFKKGEKPELLAKIRVVSVHQEPLKAIDFGDVAAEGVADHPMVLGFLRRS